MTANYLCKEICEKFILLYIGMYRYIRTSTEYDDVRRCEGRLQELDYREQTMEMKK